MINIDASESAKPVTYPVGTLTCVDRYAITTPGQPGDAPTEAAAIVGISRWLDEHPGAVGNADRD